MKRRQSQVIKNSFRDKSGILKTKPIETDELCHYCNDRLKDHEVFFGSGACNSCKLQLISMSNVKAFLCDYCGQIHQESDVVGINPVEDAFDRLKSFPTVLDPSKAIIHYCLPCYRTNVIEPAEQTTNRKKDEASYILQLSALGANFRKAVYHKFVQRKHGKKHEKINSKTDPFSGTII